MRLRFIASGLLLLSGALPVGLLTAAEAVRVGTVVVTATEESTPLVTGEVDGELSTSFSQTIKREQFDNRIATLSDAIAQQSGIQVRNSGGFGSFSSATLRGASSQQVLIFIDGLLLNDAAGGGVDLSTISLSDVERVEIYRGATPMSLGAASIGGAINIRTLKANGESRGNVTLGYGDFNTQKYSAFYAAKPDEWDYVISAERFSSDNDFEFINNNGTRLNPDDDKLEQRNNSEFEQNNLLLKLGVDLDKAQRIDTMVQWFDKRQQIPVWNNRPATNTRFDVKRLQTQLRLITNNVGTYRLNLSNTLEYRRTVEEYDDRQSSVGLGQQYDRNTTTTTKLRSFVELPLTLQLLSFIVEVSEEQYRPTDLLALRASGNSTRRTAMIGVEDKIFLLDDRLLINPAISATQSRDSLSATTLAGSIPPTNEVDRDYVTPRIGIKYFSGEWLTLKSNLGRYTRQPSFYELLGDRGFVVGNSELTNETGTNFDIGFEIALLKPLKMVKKFSWQASLFRSDVDDIIVRTYNARGVGKSENIDRANISGVENIVQITLLNNLSINFNATYQNMVNEKKNPALKNVQLPGRYKWSYNTRIDYRSERLLPFIEHRYQSGMFYDSANLLKSRNKNLINVGISWKANPATLTFELHNLTDEFYEDFRGFPQPGRAFFTTLKIDL